MNAFVIFLVIFLILGGLAVGGYFYYKSISTDCKLSEWSKCVNGEQTKSVVTPQFGLGEYCTGSTEQVCGDCTLSDWSVCNASGYQTKSILKPQSGSGTKACSGSTKQVCGDCTVSDWTVCDASGNQTRTILQPQSGTNTKSCPGLSQTCAPAPSLQDGKLQWQDNCTNCSGLVWTSSKDRAWNKYYKVSCSNGNTEGPTSDVFGPVGNNMFSNPKLRLGPDGHNNGCGTFDVNIYRSASATGPFKKIDPSNLGGFGGGVYDGKDAILVDNDNSTEY